MVLTTLNSENSDRFHSREKRHRLPQRRSLKVKGMVSHVTERKMNKMKLAAERKRIEKEGRRMEEGGGNVNLKQRRKEMEKV